MNRLARVRGYTATLLGALTGVALGCADPARPPAASQITDSAGVTIAYTRIDSTTASCDASQQTLRIGAAEGAAESELFRLYDAARLSDGRIAALNTGTAQVKIFSPAGELATQFGGSGAGPGEFKNLWSLDVGTGDTLVIADYRPWRYSYFTDAGDFLRSVELRPPIIERPDVAIPFPTGRGYLIGEACCTSDDGFAERMVTLRHYAPDGTAADTIGTFRFDAFGPLSLELRFFGDPIFGATAAFAHFRDDLFVYASGVDEQVEIWGMDGRLRTVIRWSLRDRRVRSEDATEWKRQFQERFPPNPTGRPFIDAQVGDHRPVAELFPAHAGILVGRDSHLWVKEYRRPLDRNRNRWFAFDVDGMYACQLELPGNVELFDAGADYVIGKETDELGVEYLVERRLVWP